MGWSEIARVEVLLPWLLGMVFGIFVGATPGLTATMAVALLVPLSYQLDNPLAGLAMIVGVSFSAIFAGDIPATFLRIPGTPASATATLDSYALTKQGRPLLAMRLNLICSAIGGLIGLFFVVACAPFLARVVLHFDEYEYFWLTVSGLMLCVFVSQGKFILGAGAAILGILLSTVGVSTEQPYPRFSFAEWLPGNGLIEGLQLVPVMIGLFGIGEVLRGLTISQSTENTSPVAEDKSTWRDALFLISPRLWLVAFSGTLGTLIGALPGAGADIAAWAAYGTAKTMSKGGPTFGEGNINGVIGPTSANNAAVAGAWIPALVFGIPGDSITAIVIGAFVVYNIDPGPDLFSNPDSPLVPLFAIALLTQLLLLPTGWIGVRLFSYLMLMPRHFILASVFIFSVVGSFSLQNSLTDVWVMFVAGLFGYFLDKWKVPISPLILGLVLGPKLESQLRRGLISSEGDFSPFLTRPICFVAVSILIVGASFTIWSAYRNARAKLKSDGKN